MFHSLKDAKSQKMFSISTNHKLAFYNEVILCHQRKTEGGNSETENLLSSNFDDYLKTREYSAKVSNK